MVFSQLKKIIMVDYTVKDIKRAKLKQKEAELKLYRSIGVDDELICNLCSEIKELKREVG